ncbi:MAG: response regulator [Aphanocapsa sp. GSE-SYN-MK-11-07L]|jgi:chemotaxis protein histidine kinase CheA|nr:response regulator [Aphanocapsa sp. GSE-SYN-MK-11-07L]
MSTDPSIRDQTYGFFLMEAPELLQKIEHDLLSLREDRSPGKVHNLMRLTHTLKGAAASVGLETIQTVAHSLEDVFKSLYNPAVEIDSELESLLFQGYECLRLPLSAELTNTTINEPEVLNRAAAVFAQLQAKLGDFFDQQALIPSSAELGFDIVQSIFETGVQKRLLELSALVNQAPEASTIASRLQAEATVLFGLAESLGLPGFGAIAQATLSALAAHPDQAKTIAELALADFQQGQTLVLGGDRDQGGEPSAALLGLADDAIGTKAAGLELAEPFGFNVPEGIAELELDFDQLLADLPADASLGLDLPDLSMDQLLAGFSLEVDSPVVSPPAPPSAPARPVPTVSARLVPPRRQTPKAPTPAVRIDLETLQHLNYLSGELLTYQNRQTDTNQQLQAVVQKLQQQLQQHQHVLSQIQDLTDRMLIRAERQPARSAWSRFDSLEMNPYSEFHALLQSAQEETVKLEERRAEIALFTQQSSQALEKQQRLLTQTRDDLIQVGMMPLGELFNRFPRLLEQLATNHGKPAQIQILGAEIMVEKAIAEKLYDPIMHLVRNGFAHGLESPQLRSQQGKPEVGQICLQADQQERATVIAVSDDGRGLDLQLIRQRVVELGLVSPELGDRLPEASLLDYLFEPGFSTASELTELSGRGIGLDVVKTQLQSLDGSITVQSRPQQGTTFLLEIPRRLNIARVLICQSGSQTYAFLLDAVEQIVSPQPDQIQDWRGQQVYNWCRDGSELQVPIRKLSDLMPYSLPLRASVQLANASRLLMLRRGEEHWALQVDQVLGEQELVIRPVGSVIIPPPFVQGCCILADGRLTLLIDGSALLDPVSTAAALAPPVNPVPTLREGVAAPQILVVDDSITLRQNLALVLQNKGYQPIQAKNGSEAIAHLRQYPEIRLVICDIEMPTMNGFEFLSQRAQSAEWSKIPVMMLSSRGSDKHQQIALELGADRYLTKPYLDQELLTVVTDLLDS